MGTVCYTVVNGEVLSENRDGVERDYLPDTQGNTIGLIDNTQTITDTFSYYPYGEVAFRTGTTATPFQFLGTLGYYRDSASRTYVRARTLNTAQGRWMTQDPIGFKGGDYNLYRYVASIPTLLTDPSGLRVYICTRPVLGTAFDQQDVDHWYLWSSLCGCVGYTNGSNPKGGLIWGCSPNAYGYHSTCYEMRVNDGAENCMCNLAINADPMTRGWTMCGKIWSGPNYSLTQQNCQDFITCLFCKCTGKPTGLDMFNSIMWRTDCPKYAFTGAFEGYNGPYHP